MDRKRAGWIVLCILMIGFSAFMTGCTNTGVVFENSTPEDLRVPADFIIKVTGKTVYIDNEKEQDNEIQVGEIMKQSLEKQLNKIQRFSVNKGHGNQYVVGVEILDYDLKEDAATIGGIASRSITCEAGVYLVTTNDKGEQIIGEKIFSIEPFIKKRGGAELEEGDWGIGLIHIVGYAVQAIKHVATADTSWKTVIESGADYITTKIDNAFPK